MGLGHLGFPGGGFLGGFGAGLPPWPVMGYGDSGCCFSGGGMRRCWGLPVPADVGCQPGGRYCSGVGPGGGFGNHGGALPPGWGYGWDWGAWVLVGVPPGAWVGACAWARLWCGGLRWHRCLRRGGPIEVG